MTGDSLDNTVLKKRQVYILSVSRSAYAYAVLGMSWSTEVVTGQISYIINNPDKGNVTKDGVQAFFVEDDNILISQLFIVALERLSGMNFSCSAFTDSDYKAATVTACIIGKVISFCDGIKKIVCRSSLTSHCPLTGVELLISRAQFPVSSVWRRVCGVLCGHCCQ